MMDDRVSNRMAQRKGGGVPAPDRADGARRLRHGNEELVYIGDAFDAAMSKPSTGSPIRSNGGARARRRRGLGRLAKPTSGGD